MNESLSAPVDEQAVRRDLLALEYAWEHDDWVCPLSEALEGLTAQDALRKPDPHRADHENAGAFGQR